MDFDNPKFCSDTSIFVGFVMYCYPPRHQCHPHHYFRHHHHNCHHHKRALPPLDLPLRRLLANTNHLITSCLPKDPSDEEEERITNVAFFRKKWRSWEHLSFEWPNHVSQSPNIQVSKRPDDKIGRGSCRQKWRNG